MDLAEIYAPIQRNLDALDGLLRTELATRDPFIGELVEYVLSTRGKLVRPALTCLAAEAIGGGEEERLFIAGTVELIHIASLIHDDIIDEADVRRRNPTVNVQWGNQIAVLLGDLLFARAFDLISRVRHPEVAPAVAFAAVRMSQAEIQQIEYAAEPHNEEAVYWTSSRARRRRSSPRPAAAAPWSPEPRRRRPPRWRSSAWPGGCRFRSPTTRWT